MVSLYGPDQYCLHRRIGTLFSYHVALLSSFVQPVTTHGPRISCHSFCSMPPCCQQKIQTLRRALDIVIIHLAPTLLLIRNVHKPARSHKRYIAQGSCANPGEL